MLALAALLYARTKGIPAWAALPIAAAFLIEFPFYLLPAFDPKRLRTPWILACTCVVPYLIYSIPTGQFRFAGFLALLAIVCAVAFWYALLPKNAVIDILFLALLAAIEISKVFNRIYLSPIPKLEVSPLAHVMLVRAAAIAILAIRGGVNIEYRFLPSRTEWIAGLRWFALLLPVVSVALWALGLWNLRSNPNAPAGLAEFFGILFVVALSEEFFFRGLLQQWLEGWLRSGFAALLTAALLFGASHLTVHFFPNWRYSIAAGILGLFCGLAWRETKTIQSSMVTHALAATLYKVFFV